MAAKKLRQIILSRLEDHGQIAAVHHPAPNLSRRLDQEIEITVQLRPAGGDVERRNVRAGQKTQHRIDVLPAHHLGARRSRFDVAVNAGQIAVTSQVDLQDIDSTTSELSAVGANSVSEGLHLTVAIR